MPDIRAATLDDLEQINAIYNYYVLNSHVTFDTEPGPPGARVMWFNRYGVTGRHRLLVAVDGDEVLGFASSGEFRGKAAYDPSVETSVYLPPDHTGRGIGTLLYDTLLTELADEDVHRAYAAIALPNVASVALHERLGFIKVAHLHEVGRKFDLWWDVAWYEREMG